MRSTEKTHESDFSLYVSTMRITWLVVCILLFIGCFCGAFAEEAAAAVEIVKPGSGNLQLDSDELARLLAHNDIKDRYVVIITMAGAKGKHFLLNFFVQYLRAEVRKCASK